MKGDTSLSVPDAGLKRQVKRLIKIDKSQGIRGADANSKLILKMIRNQETVVKPRSGRPFSAITLRMRVSPFSDFTSFQGFVMNWLQAEVLASEMMNEIEEMKQNYMEKKKLSNVKHSLNDSQEVTELPGMILGNVTENANDLKYPCLKKSPKLWRIDPNLCYDLLDDCKSEEFEMKWRKLIFQEENFHLDGNALLAEMVEPAVARDRRN